MKFMTRALLTLSISFASMFATESFADRNIGFGGQDEIFPVITSALNQPGIKIMQGSGVTNSTGVAYIPLYGFMYNPIILVSSNHVDTGHVVSAAVRSPSQAVVTSWSSANQTLRVGPISFSYIVIGQ
jgi:hypothetical protein